MFTGCHHLVVSNCEIYIHDCFKKVSLAWFTLKLFWLNVWVSCYCCLALAAIKRWLPIIRKFSENATHLLQQCIYLCLTEIEHSKLKKKNHQSAWCSNIFYGGSLLGRLPQPGQDGREATLTSWLERSRFQMLNLWSHVFKLPCDVLTHEKQTLPRP